jgi:hypothetical protein
MTCVQLLPETLLISSVVTSSLWAKTHFCFIGPCCFAYLFHCEWCQKSCGWKATNEFKTGTVCSYSQFRIYSGETVKCGVICWRCTLCPPNSALLFFLFAAHFCFCPFLVEFKEVDFSHQ